MFLTDLSLPLAQFPWGSVANGRLLGMAIGKGNRHLNICRRPEGVKCSRPATSHRPWRGSRTTIAFGQIAEEVLEGDFTAFDRTLLLALRNPADLSDPLGPPWLEEAARDITALGSYSVLGLVVGAVAIYLVMIRRRAAALWLLASVVGGAALSSVLKIGFDRPRPDIVAHVARVFTMSFPSGHAALSAVVYLTLGALLANSAGSRVQRAYFLTLALLLTMLVGITRIYLGVDYPTDVLAGWCFGAAWAIFAVWVGSGWKAASS